MWRVTTCGLCGDRVQLCPIVTGPVYSPDKGYRVFRAVNMPSSVWLWANCCIFRIMTEECYRFVASVRGISAAHCSPPVSIVDVHATSQRGPPAPRRPKASSRRGRVLLQTYLCRSSDT